ncbi:hypothetical protein BpHYR1_038218 [Brachionus plicatilis]|uniref:Uncharacterized protein n=1 Tax=Brachionus plicatilis TaxID=10195 RepID=A0A3M7SIS6_BRAPC|nr:hypothetical protein BpHYR1_038218 [Brachionus plicatilis]
MEGVFLIVFGFRKNKKKSGFGSFSEKKSCTVPFFPQIVTFEVTHSQQHSRLFVNVVLFCRKFAEHSLVLGLADLSEKNARKKPFIYTKSKIILTKFILTTKNFRKNTHNFYHHLSCWIICLYRGLTGFGASLLTKGCQLAFQTIKIFPLFAVTAEVTCTFDPDIFESDIRLKLLSAQITIKPSWSIVTTFLLDNMKIAITFEVVSMGPLKSE